MGAVQDASPEANERFGVSAKLGLHFSAASFSSGAGYPKAHAATGTQGVSLTACMPGLEVH